MLWLDTLKRTDTDVGTDFNIEYTKKKIGFIQQIQMNNGRHWESKVKG